MEQVLIGALITLYVWIFDRDVLKFDLDKVGKFLTFMAMVVAFRLSMQSVSQTQPNLNIPVEFWQFSMVWWEDAFYAIPLYYAEKAKDNYKHGHKLFIAFAIFMSVWFGLGHAYQGLFGIMITTLYPYFISLKFGKRVGFGTVMVCHILYDMITYATIKLGWMITV